MTLHPTPKGWVIADVWETVAATRPDADCIIQGTRRVSWAEFDRCADTTALDLLGCGLRHQSKVAFFLRNAPEFLIGVFACLKAGLVPVNTNFRYRADEAARLWENADAECVVFSGSLTDVVASARTQAPRVTSWRWVDDGGSACPPWAVPFKQSPAASERATASWGRSPDDLIMLYTGGTTGSPKGVMWRQDDVFAIMNSTAAIRYQEADGLAGVEQTQRREQRPRPRFVPCGPLIHGTAAFSSYGALGAGGAVILLPGRSFDAAELLDTIDRERVSQVSIVGEAHGRPLAELLTVSPGRWNLSSLRLITSAGLQLTRETRKRLLACVPQALCIDVLGSSETPAVALARSSASSLPPTATFALGPGVRVLDDDHRDVRPGSGSIGVLAVKGRAPLGYYKDTDRTRRLFRMIDGERWAITGDLAEVHADGTVQLLGRGATVINTGGEKVYTREVEEALLRNPAVADAAVAGVQHEVLGQMVVALVQPPPGATVAGADLISELRATLAAYKVPKYVYVVTSIGRDESGKINHSALVRRLSELAAENEAKRS